MSHGNRSGSQYPLEADSRTRCVRSEYLQTICVRKIGAGLFAVVANVGITFLYHGAAYNNSAANTSPRSLPAAS